MPVTRDESGETGSLRVAWDARANDWTRWARTPGHDSYWRFAGAAFFEIVPAAGRLTLDLGCGEGRVSRDLVARGHRVVSVDASMTLVRNARLSAPDTPALVADATALPLSDASCDLVIAYLSLQDIDDMDHAVTEAARVLQPRGHLCLSVVHPLNSAGTFEGLEGDAPFVIKGSYLDSHRYIDRVERDGLRMTFSSLHHPLEAYFGALERAGLLIKSVREVPVSAASALGRPDRERWRRLPMFLNVVAVKPG